MTTTVDRVAERVRKELGEIELGVLTEGMTLAKLIRQGSSVSEQSYGWTGDNDSVCALSAAEAALRARS